VTAFGRLAAQVRQRVRGWPNWRTQSSQTALLGQAWQTAQRLGSQDSHSLKAEKNMLPIYCGAAQPRLLAEPISPP
jgi:hypothetical protein